MTNLTPTPGWDDVPQLELNTKAQGGAGAPMNSQAQALINRTEALRSLTVSVTDPRFAGGAKGDGVTDDTAAILAAAAFTSGDIWFPVGNYLSSNTAAVLAAQKQYNGPGFLKLGSDLVPVSRFIKSSFTMSVPGNFINPNSCFWYLHNRVIDDGAIVTIKISDGTYNWPQIYPQHPYGQHIQIIGNTAAPANVQMRFDATNFNSGVQAANGYTLGLIDGVTISASNAWTSHGNWNAAITPYGAGIMASYGGVVNVGAHVVVTKCYYGIKAVYGGTINCAPGVSVTEAGDTAYHAFHGGTINALGCSAQGSYDAAFGIGYGFLGEMSGSIHAENAISSFNFIAGFAAISAGSVWAQKSQSNHNNSHGYFATLGGCVNASSPSWVTGTATVSANNSHGVRVEVGGSIEFVGSTAQNNTSDGIVASAGTINASGATSTGNTGTGQVARNNGVIYGTITSTSNGVADFAQTGGIISASLV